MSANRPIAMGFVHTQRVRPRNPPGGLALAFGNDGLDPLHPHLEPGSRGESRFLPLPNGPDATRIRPWSEGAIRSAPQTAITPLEAANRIGASLCQTAHWDRQRGLCNWMGRSEAELSDFGPEITPTSSALCGDFYKGAAGIALFLAELFHVTGDIEFRRVSLAAIAHSIRQLDRMQSDGRTSPLSFFCGRLGVAFAAKIIGVLTGVLDHYPHLECMIDRVFHAVSQPHELDVIGGNAGAIPALLALAADHRLERCRALAIALGEELCQKAIRGDSAWVPEPDDATGSPPVRTLQTGLAYGAAGIGLALLELYGATGRFDLLEAGRGEFDHEDTVFDADQGNWADGRLASGSLIYERTWCHGAPGIALSRLRAAALDPEYAERHQHMGRIAVSTTLDAIDKDLVHPRFDASLCLGLAGLGEVVLIASQLLDDQSYHDRAQELGRAMINRHSASADWPSGVASGGPNPSFMLGLAGIGHWFLPLHDPRRVPPLLLLIPEISNAPRREPERRWSRFLRFSKLCHRPARVREPDSAIPLTGYRGTGAIFGPGGRGPARLRGRLAITHGDDAVRDFTLDEFLDLSEGVLHLGHDRFAEIRADVALQRGGLGLDGGQQAVAVVPGNAADRVGQVDLQRMVILAVVGELGKRLLDLAVGLVERTVRQDRRAGAGEVNSSREGDPVFQKIR